jgi:hypothetical protein
VRRRVASVHADWLTLVEPSGPFLTLPVLRRVWPNGLDHLDTEARAEARRQQAALDADDAASATAWVEWVLRDLLDYGPRLATGPAVPGTLTHVVAEQATVLRPDYALMEPVGDGAMRTRLLVTVHPPGTRLDTRPSGSQWSATPIDRLALLCRATGVELGLVTNAIAWVLVWAPRDAAMGRATFSADLFSEEPALLDAFTSMLGARRFFAAAEGDRLEQLLAESASAQAEVTGKLGQQVRQAVELLVSAMSRANRERDGELLADIAPHQVYEAAVGVLMRCVFLLYAEERGLLPLGDDLYDRTLAVSTLLDQLREIADVAGDEPLERSTTAWHRLLALFRAVHGGIAHDILRTPPYGGGLFDPDRFPFLEGRRPGERWRETPATPLPVDDLTMLAMLSALQELRLSEAGVTETRRLTYRSLDVEQIGHVYEGLLDHSAVTLDTTSVGLIGKPGLEPEVALDDLTAAAAKGGDAFIAWLAETTTRTPRQLERLLGMDADTDTLRLLRAACDNDETLTARLAPFVHVLRPNLRGLPTVFPAGTMYVTQTGAKRDSGTAYTTRELAEEVVRHALAPLVYSPGPADGADPADWKLRGVSELLDLKVCDPAVGSGAILVAACRYLGDRLVEAWIAADAPEAEGDPDEVIIAARRAVADRCVYGVDRDPMAVEMAKLSLWLVTLSKERPFSFLDHALKAGDSLLGITDLEQLRYLHMDPEVGQRRQLAIGEDPEVIDAAVQRALDLRHQLEGIPVVTVRDAEEKAKLDAAATSALRALHAVADLVVGTALRAELADQSAAEDQMASTAPLVVAALNPSQPGELRALALDQVEQRARGALDAGRSDSAPQRNPLHWPLAFPEVFVGEKGHGFDAMVGNPPYMGNKYWRDRVGPDFQRYAEMLAGLKLGKPDLVVLFLWRMRVLVNWGGCLGALATQSLTEVQSKRLFADIVLQDAEIYRAVPSRKWPGSANVTVAVVWVHSGAWSGRFVLDDKQVPGIAADLRASTPAGLTSSGPHVLKQRLYAFEGVHNAKGLALVVEANAPLCASDPEQRYVKPYVSGEDLTADPRNPSRFVIDLTGVAERELSALPEPVRWHVMDVVRPTRTAGELSPYKGLVSRWWTFWNTREEGFGVAREQQSVIVLPSIAKHLMALRLPSGWVYTNKVVVVALTRSDVHELLLSSPFAIWAERHGGTMRRFFITLKIESVMYTFPLPSNMCHLGLASEWQDTGLDLLADFGPHLTDVLNARNDKTCADKRVERLRELSCAIDEVTLKAYGWDDIAPSYGFFDTFFGVRFSMDPTSLDEVHRRLLELNQHRYAEEVAAGLHAKKGKRSSKRRERIVDDPRLL